MRTTALTATLSAALLLAGAASASAAPPDTELITIHCDNGQDYDLLTNGNGAFTPGNIVGSTGMIVPVWFGDNMFTVVTPDGQVTEMPGEDEAKGGGNVMDHMKKDLLSCTFSQTFTLEQDEEGFPAGSVVTFSGAVMGFLTGR